MQRGQQQVSFDVYISHIKKTFDGVVAAALKSLETIGKGGGGVQLQLAVNELGGKIEEFESVCDEIYSLIAYTHTIVLERETQRELEKQISQPTRPSGTLSVATTPASISTASSPSPSSQLSRSSPLQKKTPPTPSLSTTLTGDKIEKEKEKETGKEEAATPTAMQVDDESSDGSARKPATPGTPASSSAQQPQGRTAEGRIQIIKQLESQLECARRIREELLSFCTQDGSSPFPPSPSSLLALVDGSEGSGATGGLEEFDLELALGS